VNVEDVDDFLGLKGANGWNRKSISVAAQALRAFFRYAEARGWCAAGFAKGIQAPRIYQHEDLPEGPTEKEVRQLLRSVKKRSGDEGKSPGDVRSEAAARSKTLAGQSRPAHAPGSTLSQLM